MMGVIGTGLKYGVKAVLGTGKVVAKGTGRAAVGVIKDPIDALRHGVRAVRGKDFKGNKLSAMDRAKAVGGLGAAGVGVSYIPDIVPIGRSSQPAYDQAMRRMGEYAVK